MIVPILIISAFIGNITPQTAIYGDTGEKGDSLYREAAALESCTPPDTAAAIKLYTRSAEAGFVPAMRYLGFLLYEGKGTSRNAPLGITWLKKAARKGDAASWENLGWIYRHGAANERSERLAIEAFTHGADAGRPQSAFELAQITEKGEGTACDTAAAIRLYEKALLGNHKGADIALADLARWRISRIDSDSALRLSKKYFYGKAPVAGVALLSKLLHSKGHGNPAWKAEVKTILAQATALGRGTRYDPGRSLELYYQAAIEGDPSAQFIIAELLESFPDALDDLIDSHISDSSEKEEQSDSRHWKRLASAAGITSAEEAERRLRIF